MSKLERKLLATWRQHAVGVDEPVPQYPFHPHRRWRLDLAWPSHKLGVEIQGGTFIRGKHSRGAGQHKDMEKINAAVELGWRILCFDASHLSSHRKRRGVVDKLVALLLASPAISPPKNKVASNAKNSRSPNRAPAETTVLRRPQSRSSFW